MNSYTSQPANNRHKCNSIQQWTTSHVFGNPPSQPESELNRIHYKAVTASVKIVHYKHSNAHQVLFLNQQVTFN